MDDSSMSIKDVLLTLHLRIKGRFSSEGLPLKEVGLWIKEARLQGDM